MLVPPKEGFAKLYTDLIQRLRDQRVSEHSIKGIGLAMQVAFQLGEKHGIAVGLGAIKGDEQ
jgi:hypothetical protein